MDPRHQDLIAMARNWRKFRERYIARGGDNSAELNAFEAELYDNLMAPLQMMARQGIITQAEAQQWGGDILNEWVKLCQYAKGRWWHRILGRWLFYG